MVTLVTAAQDLPCQSCFCRCRLVHHLAFFILKGTDPISFNLALGPKSVTDSHILLLVLYLSHNTLCGFTIYTGKEMSWRKYKVGEQYRKWKDSSESKRATLSTDSQSRNTHRNRIISGYFRVSPCTYRIYWLPWMNFAPHSSSLGGWLHCLLTLTCIEEWTGWVADIGIFIREGMLFLWDNPP